ncbi:AMP-binding protein [Janibacter limosus]|uniref:AMP-binding protein n=1 Tax=Janibacter limosus TaxID=53458 RepID=UPI002342C1FB|nr:AMP-binding protein [Janibacter limosus]WKV16291.1 AMP-binding protein [Janibacter limosus]
MTDPEPVAVDTDDAAVLLYTSGTTGAPKGAVLTHGNLLSCGEAPAEALDLTPQDRMGTALPLFHVFGQSAVMFTAYSAGGSLSLLRPFDPDAAADGRRAAAHRARGRADDVERHAARRHGRHRGGPLAPAWPARAAPPFPCRSRRPSASASAPSSSTATA